MTTQGRLAADFAAELDELGVGGLIGPGGVVSTTSGGSVTAPEVAGEPWTVTGDAGGLASDDPMVALRASIRLAAHRRLDEAVAGERLAGGRVAAAKAVVANIARVDRAEAAKRQAADGDAK